MTTDVDKLEVTEEEEEAFRCIRPVAHPPFTEKDLTMFMYDMDLASAQMTQMLTSDQTKSLVKRILDKLTKHRK